MIRSLVALILAGTLASADKPVVSRAALEAVEKNIDRRIEREVVESPFQLLGMTRGVYLEGFGAVFTAEVNLAAGPTLTPFRSALSKEDISRLHQRKLERLPVLKRAMREMLVAAAASLDALPREEQVVVGVSLFHHSWEDLSNLPGQIVMQARRQTLVEFQTGQRNRSQLEAAIKVQEF